MNATTNRFKSGFDNWPILDGREYIEADLGGGVTVRAYIEIDQFAQPGEWATEEDIKAFNEDRLRFCDMSLHVYIDGACIEENVATLGEIGITEDSDTDGDYLTECANDLLSQTDVAAIVGGFAKKATAAAKALKASH
jgi:hypothetical protein